MSMRPTRRGYVVGGAVAAALLAGTTFGARALDAVVLPGAVALVAAEAVGAAVSLSPASINVGHAAGLLVGLATAALVRDCADVPVIGGQSGDGDG